MSKSNYEISTIQQIWDNNDGSRIEVGEDDDGLMIELRQFRSLTSEVNRFAFETDEQCELVIKSLTILLNERKNKKLLKDNTAVLTHR